MADSKLSALTDLAGPLPAAAELYINDAGISKKVNAADALLPYSFEAGSIGIGSGALDSMTAGAVDCTALGTNAGTAQAGAGDDDNVWIGTDCGLLANGSASGGNTGVGSKCLDALTTGIDNTCLGFNAGGALSTASGQVSIGARAMAAATDNTGCTAVGTDALAGLLTGGLNNTAVGQNAGTAVTTGDGNVYLGYGAAISQATGSNNVAIGKDALADGTGVSSSVAIGQRALESAISAGNTAVGDQTLRELVSGLRNTAVGASAGLDCRGATDDDNTLIGALAGTLIASGTGGNTAVGSKAMDQLTTGGDNIGIGLNACSVVTTGGQNVMVGNDTATSATGSTNQICIGDTVVATANDQCSIGKSGAITSNDFGTDAVWTNTSDARKKRNIQDSTLGLEFINDLRPTTFQFRPADEWPEEWGVKPETSVNTEKVMHGLIAQEVKEALDKAGVDDFAGWSQTPTGQQQIGKSMFVFPLIKAVQELTLRIQDLEGRLEENGD